MSVLAKALKIIIIEDNIPVAEEMEAVFRKKLEPKLQLEEIEVVHVENMAAFEKIKHSPENKYVVDLHLGGNKGSKEGIEILKFLYKMDAQYFWPIIYTAHDNKKTRELCYQWGIHEDHFISKDDLDVDIPKIGDIIYNDIEKIANLEDFEFSLKKTKTSAAKTDSDTQPKPTDKYDKSESNVMDIFPRSNSISLEKQYISVYSDVISIYDSLPINAKLAVCKFFLSPFNRGYNSYSVCGKIIDLDLFTTGFGEETHHRTKLFLSKQIDRESLRLKSICQHEGDKVIQRIDFSTFDAIKAYRDNHEESFSTASQFIIDLAELFAAQELAHLYQNSNLIGMKKIMSFASNFAMGIGGTYFISTIWEETTQYITEDARETRRSLLLYIDYGFPDIEEIFYCRITNINEENNIVDTEVISLEDISDPMPRSFDWNLLNQAGIEHTEACFKLIIFNQKPNREYLSGRTFFIEPMPISTYHKRLE